MFDGDEMNAHVAQSYEASTELEEIAAVPHQIITPRDAKPIIGVVQDTLVGSYRITRPGNEFNLREYMNLMMWNKRFDGQVPQARAGDANAPRWTGHQVVSVLLPPLNLSMPNSSYEDQGGENSENYIKIVEGDIKQGTIDKSIFSKPSKGIIHTTYNDYGAKDTVNMIDSFQHTIEQYLILNGFSVGISDLIADGKTKEDMDVVIKDRKDDISKLLHQIHLDLFDNNTGKKNHEEFESRVFASLNKATEQAGKIGQSSLSNDNRMMAMVRAGSKGGTINIAQMMACVGQQNIEGKRIPYGYTDRTLPHYKKYDDGAEARGFVESSFIRGLTPQEFFFHAMSGREGLIDTAVKTADTGYIQRKLVKGMEDLVVQHDGTVRDANMNVVQFHYGEDGVNATKIESQALTLGKLSEADIKDAYSMGGVDFSTVFMEGVERESDEVEIDRFIKQVLKDRIMIVEGVFGGGRQGGVYSPVNIERLITNLTVKFGLTSVTKTDLTPLTVLAGIQKVIQRTQEYHRIWAALLRYYLAPHRIIVENRFTKGAFEALCEVLVVKNWQSWVQPGELVGILAAQSIGEPSTQMTLNSVDFDTKIIVSKNGEIQNPMIGEFIDSYLDDNKNKDKIQTFPNSQLYLELNDGNDWKAMSADEDGNIVWTKLEAITRHPVVNDDGSNTILEVELESGRKVKATKGKSFLTYKDNKLVDTNGSDLKVGDSLPITNSLSLEQLGYINELQLRKYYLKNEWIYGTEVEKALSVMKSCNDEGNRNWFKENNGKIFTVPYSRSDSFRDAFVNGRNSNILRSGCVYPKRTRTDVSHIPETINLDEDFGFFVGAYLAEGMSNNTQVNITNNDMQYLERIKNLMDKWNVGTHIVCENRFCGKTNIRGKSTSLVIHSTLLSDLMTKLFGRVSYEKKIPNWVLQAPDTFVKGLMDGYISGDGTISKKQFNIMATSVSEELLVGIRTLLTRYGIFSKISSRMPSIGKFKSVRRNYTLYIRVNYSIIFASHFSLTSVNKQSRIEEHMKNVHNVNSLEVFNGVVFDKIVSIKECVPIKGWVYDLTVEKTRNFTSFDNIALKDTFHLAGVASKSNVTRGVPRLKELLTVTQNPKATSLTVYLKPEFRELKEKAREVAQDLELTLLRDITMKAAIYYDPTDEGTILNEDKDVISFYKLFEQTANVGEEDNTDWSKWMMRIELDREKMFNKNITMNDVAFVLRDSFSGIDLVYTDYNSKKLMMRIRVPKGNEMDDLQAFKKFQNKVLNGIVIRGVTGIKSSTFREDKEKVVNVDGKYEAVKQYIIDTDGSNYMEVMNHPAVDGNRLYSTNVLDVYEQLGIEAARNVLLTEITTLFEEVGVNYRHLGLLCDVMTRPGKLMSIDRYGINKSDIGPIAKASFEETERILLRASQFGEVDPITGVSANIMVGQPIRGGTNFSSILLDEDALVKMSEGITQNCTIEEEEDGVVEDDEIVDEMTDPCATSKFNVNIAMPKVQNTIIEEDMELVIM